jgi:multimeric flavodoxin WrbA
VTSTPAALAVLGLICSLKPSPAPSSSELIAEHVFGELRKQEVRCEGLRCVDFAIAPGVQADMGHGDEWPRIREKVLAADILSLSTLVWLGHPCNIAQRVLERLDAELSNKDDAGTPVLAGKVAVVSVVGDEDGAHKVIADLFQSLNDIGYSVQAQGSTYWNGAAMESTDYNDLDEVPEAVTSATAAAARNAAHLARALRSASYPPYE